MKPVIMRFGIVVIVAFVFTAISTATASAETTKILPEPTATEPLTDTVTQSEPGHLLSVGGVEVKCKTGAGKEIWTSANSGEGEVNFKECASSLSTTCTGKGIATEGEIVSKGDVHFWLAVEMLPGGGTQLIGALVFLILPATEFTCVNKAKTVKEEIVVVDNSCVAAKGLNLNSLVSTVNEEFTELTGDSGETLILEVLPAGTTSEIKCLPTVATNGGTAELAAISAQFAISTYKKDGSAITVEPMNPEVKTETTKLLPEPTVGAPLTATLTQSSAGHLLSVGGLEVKCKTGSGSEKWTSANNGSWEMEFKECTSALSTTCTGKGESAGEIAAKGSVHFWLALQMESGGSKLIGALVFLILPATEFTCVNKAKTIKEEIVLQENSCVAAKNLNVNSLVSTVNEEFTELTGDSGETLILEVLPAGTTSEIKCLPTVATNGGTAELAAISAKFAVSTYKKGGSAITVEPMNPEVKTIEPTKILPEPTAGAPLTDTLTQSRESDLLAVGGFEVRCNSGSGSESFTSANNGTAELAFKGCISTILRSITCTGKGLAEGEIEVKSEVHFWLALQMETGGSKLIGALVFLITPAVEFTCTNPSKSVKFEAVLQNDSCIAAKDLNINSLTSAAQEELTEWATGETFILEVLPAEDAGEIPCLPTDTFNGGAAELFAIAANFEVSGYKKGGSAITIELMNPEG
jgi:formylmethanofuran dehydrogenase subunit C